MNQMTVRRKLAIATWGPPREGNIYGKLTVDATNALLWLDHVRKTTGEKVTITHFVGRVVGEALAQAPSCLLYTSPSPRDRYGSRMPSSA